MHGEFHEDCVCRIKDDLVELLDPKCIEVIGDFKPRGGISFVPCAEWHHPDYELLKII
jgi:7-cyano-7-deazaguanine reductase